MKIVSLFSGTGGLDRGFENEGFKVVWANEYDKSIWSTFESNFPHTVLDRRSIVDINPNDAPECDGIIGGPPCQSWSEAGAARGINDPGDNFSMITSSLLKPKNQNSFLLRTSKDFYLANIQMLLIIFLKHF
jgi:DNA (cytosine-5)-methyltransferase 1